MFEDRYADEEIYDREVGEYYVTSQTIRFLDRDYDPDEVTVYITSKGDDLMSIAELYYDDFTLWYLIAEKNSFIVNPFDLPVGVELIIPDM